jgi:hypothetical protein
MNLVYRKMVMVRVRAAVAAAGAASGIRHAGLKGQLREIAVRELFRPMLPADVGLGTGEIIDATGGRSRQHDVVLFDRRILPPVLGEGSIGIFPVESVMYAIEVKSRLTRKGMREAHEAARELWGLSLLSGTFEGDVPIPTEVPRPIVAMFAFDSSLDGKKQSEVDRYDLIRGQDPAFVSVICVAGRGYWYWHEEAWVSWPLVERFDEVVGFISGVMNTYANFSAPRGRPRLGNYLLGQDLSDGKEE